MRAPGILTARAGLLLLLALGCARPEPSLEVTYWYLRG